MLANHLTIGLSDDGTTVEFKPVHPLLHDWTSRLPLADLEKPGVDAAISMLGCFALEALRNMHPEVFAAFPGLLNDPAGLPAYPLHERFGQLKHD